MWTTFPLFGSALLLCVMLAASYTFATALVAGSTGRVRTLQAARLGAYGTVALIAVAVLVLAYAFVSHDFRLRYVSHYSDRSMSVAYLLTSLWGGQDGSLLWWMFLLSLYIGACIRWLGHRYLDLQPYIIATLMVVIVFFCILMTFAANPFATGIGGAKNDGEGLNPLLQNFYMIIHPPSLYTGFVGCTVPFAFAVAALVTGRLDHEWIVASRKWTLFAWMFLAIGNTLGMLWAYEELGWGGYWAWDPVENAAFMPFLTASAFVHSVMIQERRGMLKVWNVFLICLTFFMTIFGTFLTRSGAIASVHSFAQSGIGIYFVYFLCLIASVSLTLVLYRWPELRNITPAPKLRWAAIITGWILVAGFAPGIWLMLGKTTMSMPVKVIVLAVSAGIVVYAGLEVVYRRMTRGLDMTSDRPELESLMSREFTFLMNNWALLGFLLFVLVATTFPMLTEAISGEKVTVGPPYYNAWVQPLGLLIIALMGIGTLFGWKKTSPGGLRKAFFAPTVTMVVAIIVHAAFGRLLGFPSIVFSDPIYPGALGTALRGFNAVTPAIGVALVAFNAAVIIQEFVMLFRSRRRSGASKGLSGLWVVGLVLSGLTLGGLIVMRGSFQSKPTFIAAAVIVSLVALAAPYFLYTLITLPPPSRRRFGGYIVHFGIVTMFLGFTGKSWTVDRETSMVPGQTYSVEGYTLEYKGPRMEVDTSKRMIFADVQVSRGGRVLGTMSPAKFIFKKMPDSPTTEVAMMHSVRDDLYLVVGTINPQTKTAAIQIHINPLVSWIWLGAIILIFGSIISMWPELAPEESRVWAYSRGLAATAASITMGILIAVMPAPAFAQMSSLHSGTVHIESDRERALFNSVRCMCGGCARDLLSTCACDWADDARAHIREQIISGMSNDDIVAAYQVDHGSESLAVPPNAGMMRAIYALPLAIFFAGGAGMFVVVRRWRRRSAKSTPAPKATKKRDAYDDRLDEELDHFDAQ